MTISTVMMNSLSVRKDGEYLRLLWEESTGSVFLESSYGSWSYRWTCIGNLTLAEFLSELDMSYMGKKMCGSGFRKFSDEATQDAIRSAILSDRRQGYIGKALARAEWELLQRYVYSDLDFSLWADGTEYDDPWEFCRNEPNSDWLNMWKKLWEPLVQPELRKLVQK